MKITYRILLVLFLFTCVSCGSKKQLASATAEKREITDRTREAVEEITNTSSEPKTYADKIRAYINRYAGIAMEEMELYKIPASITLAQGILESGSGYSTLTRTANNHFGIKCHGWTGGKVYHDDDTSDECFRKYKDSKYSYRDHSLFLSGRSRYAFLFELDPNDYKGWAEGLREAGYATDRKYPEKLISIIERYELYKFDNLVLGNGTVAYEYEKESPNRRASSVYVVKQGDTLYSISRRYDLTVEELKKYNNLKGNIIGIGQVLYVTP